MTTLAEVKESRIPESVNIHSGDSRLLQYVNEASERLLNRGKWWGTCGRFNITIDSQLLTLPQQIATIEQISVCKSVIPIRSMWFEFLPGGYGERDSTLPCTGLNECIYRGNYPTIRDIDVAGTLTFKCDVASDVGKSVLVLGYDTNGNWVRTLTAGVWNDGEPVLLAQGTGTSTVTSFSRVVGLQFPSDLDGQNWLYLGDTITGTLLGNYQYWEVNPSYKRYIVPFIGADVSTVTVMGKLAFRPVVKDTDIVIPGNLAALKLACMAAKAEEENDFIRAGLLWNGGVTRNGQSIVGAIQLLDQELNHHTGDGEELGLTLTGSGYGYGIPVETLI